MIRLFHKPEPPPQQCIEAAHVGRPVIGAAETWEMDPVMHIFELPDAEVKSDNEALLNARDVCAGWLAFVKSLQASALGLPNDVDWAGKPLKDFQSDIEEGCHIKHTHCCAHSHNYTKTTG